MAESMLIAFGRYLKLLRERRGLSLDDVATLTRAYPDPVSKSYLSRVEHGQCRVGFSKMIALARAYEVPIEAVAERLSLDLEVDKLEMPKTDGLGFDDRIALANKAIRSGRHWVGYAVARDAAPYADGASKPASFFSGDARSTAATTSAACARALGKNQYALHEFTHLKDSAGSNPKTKIAALQQMAATCRFLQRFDESCTFATEAVERARLADVPLLRAYSLDTLAIVTALVGRREEAIEYSKEAIKILRDHDAEDLTCHVLINLANIFVGQKRFGAARRALSAAERTARRLDNALEVARCRITLGELAMSCGAFTEAKSALREGIDIARRIGHKAWAFKGEYKLYSVALREQDDSAVRALRRRLVRLAPAVPSELDELRAFRSESHRDTDFD